MPISRELMAKYPGGSIRSPEWLAIRAEILAREDHRCKWCQVPDWVLIVRGVLDDIGPVYMLENGDTFRAEDGEHVGCLRLDDLPGETRITRVVLTIAHLDQDVTNNGEPGDRPNLAALCQRCHNVHDGPHRRRNAERTRRGRGGQKDLFA